MIKESLIKLGAEIKVVDIDGNILFYTHNGNLNITDFILCGSGVLSKNNLEDNTLHHCINSNMK